jgi:hypothetical protein
MIEERRRGHSANPGTLAADLLALFHADEWDVSANAAALAVADLILRLAVHHPTK